MIRENKGVYFKDFTKISEGPVEVNIEKMNLGVFLNKMDIILNDPNIGTVNFWDNEKRYAVMNLFDSYIDSIEEPDRFFLLVKNIIEKYFDGDELEKLNMDNDYDYYLGEHKIISELVNKYKENSNLRNKLKPEQADDIFLNLVTRVEDNHTEHLEEAEVEWEELRRTGNLYYWGTDEGFEEENKKYKNINSVQYEVELEESDAFVWDGNNDEETILINELIASFGRCGGRQSVDKIFELLEQYKTGISGPAKEVFSKIDPAYCAQKLMDLLQKTDDLYDQVLYSQMIYALELGKIGVSGSVVNYLEKEYELQGKQKGEVDFARRITRDGKIGLLDKGGALIGYFELGNLADPNKKRQAQILEVARELLFADPEANDSLRQQFLQDYTRYYEEFFSEEIGVRLSDLNLREQFWFYNFLQNTDKETREKAIEIKDKFGRNGVKTFIAFESDRQAGEKIFKLADSDLRDDLKENIFSKYVALIDILDRVDQELAGFFSKEQRSREVDTGRLTKEIADRVQRVLYSFVEKIDKENFDEAAFADELKEINRDVQVFAAIFKTAFKGEKQVDFAEVRGLDLESRLGVELATDEETVKQMIDIINDNYPDEPEVAEEMEELLNNPEELRKNRFVVLIRTNEESKKDIVSFLRIEKRGDKRVYVGGFNVNRNMRGSAVGEQMINQVIGRLLREGNAVEAVMVPELAAGTHYVEKAGAVAKHYDKKAHGTFHGWFEIEIGGEPLDCRLVSKDKEELLKMYEQKFKDTNPLSHIGEDVILVELKADLKDKAGMERIADISAELLNKQGYVMSRYICLDKACKKRLYGFEKDPAKMVQVAEKAA